MTDHLLTVSLDPGDAAVSRLHQTVLASLPACYRLTAAPGAEVQLVSGDHAGWHTLARSAVATGARAIMLTGTQALTAETIRSFGHASTAKRVLVAVDTAFASDRSWTEALPALTADTKAAALLDSVITVPRPDQITSGAGALRSALAEQLAVVRPLLGDLAGLTTTYMSGWSYVLGGVVEDVTVTLSGVLSGAGGGRLDLDLVGSGRHWQAHFDADALARPARISVSDPGGSQTRPAVFESAHRAGWLNLHHAICHHAPFPYEADQLATDLALAEAALPGLTDGGTASSGLR